MKDFNILMVFVQNHFLTDNVNSLSHGMCNGIVYETSRGADSFHCPSILSDCITFLVLASLSPSFHSPCFLFICIYCLLHTGTCITIPLLIFWPVPPALLLSILFTHPHRFLLLLFFLPFYMCARVWGARHCVQPSGLKVNTYVIANCLQSLGAALKKDMLCRQLRPLAFASLSDRICFKGLVYLTPEQRVYC